MSTLVDKISSARGKAFWGPPAWFILHVLAASLHSKNSKYYENLLKCFAILLPCEECRKNLIFKLQSLPPTRYLSNKEDAFLYSYTIHDMANQQISVAHPDAPKKSPGYDEIRKFYFEGLKNDEYFWEDNTWFVVHMMAATLRPETAIWYKDFLFSLAKLLPTENLRTIFGTTLVSFPPDAYLSNNNDAFFYSYAIRDIFNSKLKVPKKSQNYDDMKSFYFTGLFQECKEC